MDVCLSFTLVFILPTITATPNLLTVGEDGAVNFVKQTTEFPQGGEYSGDKFYPYKEVIIFAPGQVAAQRAATTIYNARNLLQGSNLFGMLGGSPWARHPSRSKITYEFAVRVATKGQTSMQPRTFLWLV